MKISGIILLLVVYYSSTFCNNLCILHPELKSPGYLMTWESTTPSPEIFICFYEKENERNVLNYRSEYALKTRRKEKEITIQENRNNFSSIKFDFFSPLRGCFGLSFETAMRDHLTLDIEIGYIGIKPHNLNVYKNYSNYTGAFITGGTRYYLKNDDLQNDLQGIYFKPQILANYFLYERQHFLYDSATTFHEFVAVDGIDMSVGLLICSGAQLLLSDFFIVDIWAGFGYGGNWIRENSDLDIEDDQYFINQYNKFSHWQILRTNVIVDCGISLGLLIK